MLLIQGIKSVCSLNPTQCAVLTPRERNIRKEKCQESRAGIQMYMQQLITVYIIT